MYVLFHSNFAASIVCRRYKPCEFPGFVWTDCWDNKSYYVITSSANDIYKTNIDCFFFFSWLNYEPLVIYSLIAFDERATFCLQQVRSLPCACAYVALFARRLVYNHYVIAHAYDAANTHVQGSDPTR